MKILSFNDNISWDCIKIYKFPLPTIFRSWDIFAFESLDQLISHSPRDLYFMSIWSLCNDRFPTDNDFVDVYTIIHNFILVLK